MSFSSLSHAQIVVVERDTHFRQLLRGMLTRVGIDKVQEYSNLSDLLAQGGNGSTPDLMILEADQPDGEVTRFCHALRHGQIAPQIGANPFVSIILTAWQPTPALMMRCTGSGADDLMVKPFSAKSLKERLHNLADRRKPFVVTSDYVGPDRRRTPREGQTIPLIEVPNSLRERVRHPHERAALTEQIARVQEEINRQKIMRHGFQIAFLIEYALPGLHDVPPQRMAVEHLQRVPGVLEDLMLRLPADDLREQVEPHGQALNQLIAPILADPSRPPGEPFRLRRASLDLAAAAMGRSGDETLEQEIAATVTAYRSRLEHMAQAKAVVVAET